MSRNLPVPKHIAYSIGDSLRLELKHVANEDGPPLSFARRPPFIVEAHTAVAGALRLNTLSHSLESQLDEARRVFEKR